jgi:hypothetical protein
MRDDDDQDHDPTDYGPGGGYTPGIGDGGPDYDDDVKDADAGAGMPPGAMALHGLHDAYLGVRDRVRDHMKRVEHPKIAGMLAKMHDHAEDRAAGVREAFASLYPDHDGPEDDELADDMKYEDADEDHPLADDDEEEKRRGYRRKSDLDAMSDEELLAEQESLLREYRYEAEEFADGL